VLGGGQETTVGNRISDHPLKIPTHRFDKWKIQNFAHEWDLPEELKYCGEEFAEQEPKSIGL